MVLFFLIVFGAMSWWIDAMFISDTNNPKKYSSWGVLISFIITVIVVIWLYLFDIGYIKGV